MSDLVERLRKKKYASAKPPYDRYQVNPDGPEAADEIERLQCDMKGLGTLATLVYRRFYQGNPGWENWRAALNGKDLIDQIELMTRPEIMENSDTAGMNHIHRSIILGEKQR